MILVGTTLCHFALSDPDVWGSWLKNAEAMKESHSEGVQFFAAIEIDARGLEPFKPLLDRLAEIDGGYWTFSLDDGRTEVSTQNRLSHITMGQNLVTDYATSTGASHLLFMAADCMPPPDAIPKLLEVNHPLVGGEVTTYVLSGPDVEGYPFPVQSHMATAAFIFIRRDVFKQLRWRWDPYTELSDDPCYHLDALTLLGIPTYVRKDVIGQHFPEHIGAVEGRGYDMTVVRNEH